MRFRKVTDLGFNFEVAFYLSVLSQVVTFGFIAIYLPSYISEWNNTFFPIGGIMLFGLTSLLVAVFFGTKREVHYEKIK